MIGTDAILHPKCACGIRVQDQSFKAVSRPATGLLRLAKPLRVDRDLMVDFDRFGVTSHFSPPPHCLDIVLPAGCLAKFL